ncbi:YbaB/EbfC family nucleoid-associated protein [Chloroflexi bacterium TSY]|nr:YbaB/EbfC family nucleoid-associated protein [Chloroflexi bacterium TSY]
MAKKKKSRAKLARPRKGGGFGGGGGGFGGGGGASGGNMGGLMNQMQKLQEEMEKTQDALGDEEVTATSGGGMVTVVASGKQEIRSISIEPDAVDPDDVEMLEDLVLAAVNEALQKSQELAEEKMGGLTSGLGLPPGLGL